MNAYTQLLAALLISLIVSLAVLHTLKGPLLNVLRLGQCVRVPPVGDAK